MIHSRFLACSIVAAALVATAGCCSERPLGAMLQSSDCGKPIYRHPDCSIQAADNRAALGAINDTLFGCAQPATPPAAAPMPHCDPASLPKDAKVGEVWCCVKVQPPAAAPESICTCPEQTVEVPVAAVFQTVERQVEDQPARTEWQNVNCPEGGGGECWKLVSIPATLRTVSEQVQVSPPSVRHEVIPAKFEMKISAPPPPYWEWRRTKECEGANHPAAIFIGPIRSEVPQRTASVECTDGSCPTK